MREINEAKVATMIRPGAARKTRSKASSMTASESVQPGRSALVLSDNNASTPRFENSASFEPVVDDDPQKRNIVPVGQVVQIGDDVIQAKHVIFGELQAGIDNNGFRAVLESHHVFADLSQSTQRDDPHLCTVHVSCSTPH